MTNRNPRFGVTTSTTFTIVVSGLCVWAGALASLAVI